MIKTIIFDNNGVLTTSCGTGALDDLISFLGVEKENFLPIWEEEAIEVDKGSITTEQFLKNVFERLKINKDFDQCKKYYWDSYETKDDVRAFAKELKKQFEIVLLTNFGDDFYVFNKKWDTEGVFDKDKIFVSADLGMVKPDEDIYLYTLEKIGKKPDEVVFIDDKEENIDTARKVGMHTILFKSLDQVEKDLESILQHQPSCLPRT